MGWNDRMCPHELKRMFPDVYRDTYPNSKPEEVIRLRELVDLVDWNYINPKRKEPANE